MYTLINKGGPIMWLLMAASIFSVIVFLQKLLQFHRSQINSRDFLDGIYNVLKRGNTVEAVTICEDTPGPVARIARAAILRFEEKPEEITLAIQQAGLLEIPRIEHNLIALATIGKISPSLGLLGTVLGMISTLGALHSAGPLAHAGDLSGGLWQALLTTAAGLGVAIPVYMGYNFLVSRAEALVLDMEQASADIYSYLMEIKRARMDLESK
ncbi:MAG: biopolymer transport protein ExbB [Kiritimatiellia bacterium]|jgi:biopolymer transport protein ExbB